jgi:adenylate kinase family enzyme
MPLSHFRAGTAHGIEISCALAIHPYMLKRVYITGASGCGVTTLGRVLAGRLGGVHIDTDDHYWIASEPPYREARALAERLGSIRAEQQRCGRWVVSGSLEGWGESVIQDADLIVFLEAPTATRLRRLRQREYMRFGKALLPGGTMFEAHRQFIQRTSRYDCEPERGRSRVRHEKWLMSVANTFIRLDATRTIEQLVTEISFCS